MKNKITIAGLSITLNFCHRINKEPIKSVFTSDEPLATIYKSQKKDTYTVNIVAHIPVSTKNLTETNLGSGLFLDKNKTLFLNYNGVNNIDTSIFKSDQTGILLCRDFGIEYNSQDTIIEDYNLYHIQFDYNLFSESFQLVEAIIVRLINEDPETDRGTVTTVRKDKQ